MALLCHWQACAQATNVLTFAATRAYPVGGVGFSVATGDFNKDGKADLAVAVGSVTNTVQIFLGNGDGTLQPPIMYTPASFPTSIAVADVNHDGNPDLMTDDVASEFYVLLGNGNGTFQSPIKVTGTLGYPFAVGRFDSDTNVDLVTASSIFLWVRRGNGDGSFQAATDYTISTSEGPMSFAVADMNGDHTNDIVVGTSSTATGHVSVLLGRGDGTFYGASNTVSSLNNSTLAVSDFNLDGSNDVAVANYDAGTVAIFLGNNNGTLRSNAVYSVGVHPTALTVADFNNDGTNDFAVATAGAVSILLGHGDGTFQLGAVYDSLWETVVAADFSGDGRMDLAADVQAGSGKVGISLGNGDGTFQIAPHYPVGPNPQFVAMGDVNNDGHPDLVVANFGTNYVSVLLNNGNGTFQPTVNYPTAFAPQSLAIADLNGDGTNDIVATTLTSTNQLSVLLAKGNGTFQPLPNYGSYGGGPIAAGDFNGDHKFDILANSLLTGMQGQLGNGSGSFVPAVAAAGVNAFGFSPATIAIGRFNADTNLDFTLVNSGSTNVYVFLGKGDGTFQSAVSYTAGTNCQSIAVGDFNGDSNLDLAIADGGTFSVGDGSVSVLLGNGNGTFQPAIHYFAGADPDFVTCADFNGDGKLDLAVRGISGFGMFVSIGNGDGTFQPPVYFATLNDALYGSIAVGDLNGDGKPDAAVLNLTNSVSILLNTHGTVAPVGPTLGIVRNGASFLLSWPVTAGAVTVESTVNLNAPDWQPVPAVRTTNNGQVQVTLPYDPQGRFFRLHQP